MSSNGATPAQYTIKATKGYVDTTFTFKNDPSSVIESVKIKLDGVSMLAKKNSALAANGAEGTYAKVTKADGTSDGIQATTTTTVTEGYAYESGYYMATVNLDSGLNKWTTDKTTEYVKSGDKLVVTITRNEAMDLTTIDDTWTATGTGVESCKVTLKTAGTTTVKPVVEYTVTLGTLSNNTTITLK